MGNDNFSDQLIWRLRVLKDEYIWYTLDDFWIQEPINFEYYWGLAKGLKCDALRLQPNVQENSLPYRFKEIHFPQISLPKEFRDTDSEIDVILKQLPESEYIMSMQTSIWRRDYFLECLTPGLDPWELEKTRPKLGNVYYIPRLPFWYIDATRKGVLTDKAKKLI